MNAELPATDVVVHQQAIPFSGKTLPVDAKRELLKEFTIKIMIGIYRYA